MNNTSLCTRVLRCLSEGQAENAGLRNSIKQCKSLGKRVAALTTIDFDAASASIGADMPSRAVADQLLDAYFETLAGVFPVLHLSSFRAQYESYWAGATPMPDAFIHQMQLCLALGVKATKEPLQFGHAPVQWLCEASSWLGRVSAWPRERQTTFEELQASCLLCLAGSSGSAGERAAWVDAGNLVRKAMALDLHRDPTHLGFDAPDEIDLRRKLWVTIMEINLMASLQAAQPPLIAGQDWRTESPAILPPGNVADAPVSVQPFLSKSLPLRLDIASSAAAAETTMSLEDVIRLHRKLSQAHEQLKTDLAAEHQGKTCKKSHRRLASLFLTRSFLALHLPLLGRHITDPTFYFPRRASASVAIQMLELCGIKDTTRDEATSALRDLFVNHSGLPRGIGMQAVCALLLELVTSADERRDGSGGLPAWDEAELRQCARSGQTWMEQRLRAGSIEVHSCCLIAACIAYASALNNGDYTDAKQAVIAAALETSKRCEEVLAGTLSRPAGLSTGSAVPIGPALSQAAEPVTNTDVVAFDDWQSTLTFGGADDFFGFDWSLMPESSTALFPEVDTIAPTT